MAKNIEDLIIKGEELKDVIYEEKDEYEEVEQYLPEQEYAQWKAECATYLETEYKGKETTKIFLAEFNNASVGDIEKYKKLLGYMKGIYNNEIDGTIRPKSKGFSYKFD